MLTTLQGKKENMFDRSRPQYKIRLHLPILSVWGLFTYLILSTELLQWRVGKIWFAKYQAPARGEAWTDPRSTRPTAYKQAHLQAGPVGATCHSTVAYVAPPPRFQGMTRVPPTVPYKVASTCRLPHSFPSCIGHLTALSPLSICTKGSSGQVIFTNFVDLKELEGTLERVGG